MRIQVFPGLFTLMSSIIVVASCMEAKTKNDSMKNADSVVVSDKIIENTVIGKQDGIDVVQYTLTNKNGVGVKIINYGAHVTNIIVPDKNNEMGDVVLGFDSLADYASPANSFFGAIAGRYANRIAKGTFKLDGQTYQLATNNNGNSLHGGLKGFDKVIWNATTSMADTSITLKYASKDGEEGYPGNLNVEVKYKLTDDNALEIIYKATSDKATPVNLTNHTYFNLSAGKKTDILDHALEMWTSEPAVQFYSGNFLKGQKGKGGAIYNAHAGLCLEAQHYPDSPNHPEFPSTILRPGETYAQTTIYKFGK
ncbi:MAG: galactose mutarotase [Chitinophagaceae bacterium]|nr:MAG: galactose mutarotase [Chitinophagaceae bacterium]